MERKQAYDASSIETLDGITAVRVRPGMYLGSVDKKGLHHTALEIISNSIDEAINGHGDKIIVKLLPDGSISIQDFGRGIPVDKMKNGTPAVEEIMTNLHSGGKLGKGQGYSVSGGLHGVGATVVNALSEWMEVYIVRNGNRYMIRMEKGKIVTHLTDLGKTKSPSGTMINFLPDKTIFNTIEWDYNQISETLRMLAFLTKKVVFELIDIREETEQKQVFCYEGLNDYVEFLNKGKTPLTPIVHFIDRQAGGDFLEVEVAFQYVEGTSEQQKLFTNNIPNESGTHQTGFKTAFTKVLNNAAMDMVGTKLNGDLIREGLTSIISIKMKDPIFSDQNKTKLTNTGISGFVQTATSKALNNFFESNPAILDMLVQKAYKAQKADDAAMSARQAIRSISSSRATGILSGLPEKLADCSSKNIEKRELFLVEGDSAAGSAKSGRDREIQAIMPLRGKVKNSENADITKLIENKEIKSIFTILGCGVDDMFDISKLRYDKVIIMADADADGGHIKILLLTFFFRFMPELILNGHLYGARPPLYKVVKGKNTYYITDDAELEEFKKAYDNNNLSIQYLKGLGEMNAEQLWESTMNPDTRTLVQYTIEDAAIASRLFDSLMGSNSASKKEFLFNYKLEA